MEKFHVTILGCSSARPSLRHHQSAQLVSVNSKNFLIDCGEGTQTQLMKARCNINRLQHIFISHIHGDHCYGLPGLISSMRLAQQRGEIFIHISEEGAALLSPLIDHEDPLKATFVPYEHAKRTIYEDRTLTVTTVPLRHRTPCVGFIFREKPKPRHINPEATRHFNVPVSQMAAIKAGADFVAPDGTVVENKLLTTPADPSRAYAYISDTLPLRSVAEEAAGVDLLYHEATFLSDMPDHAAETMHSTAAQAAAIARDAHARRLVIGHFSSRYTADDEAVLLAEAQAIFPDTILADELLTVAI